MKNLGLILLVLLIGCSSPKEDGRAGSTAATASGAQPDAAAHRGGHRALRGDQARECKYRVVPRTPVTTRIDSKTGHTVIVCKKMPETR